MAGEKSSLVELAKYPVAVLSIFLALVGAKYVLDIPFGSVSPPVGIDREFAVQYWLQVVAQK